MTWLTLFHQLYDSIYRLYIFVCYFNNIYIWAQQHWLELDNWGYTCLWSSTSISKKLFHIPLSLSLYVSLPFPLNPRKAETKAGKNQQRGHYYWTSLLGPLYDISLHFLVRILKLSSFLWSLVSKSFVLGCDAFSYSS